MPNDVHRDAPPVGSVIARTLLLLATLTILPAQLAHAQSGILTGTVTTARSDEPVPGATISIEGTRLGALSSPTGAFRVINIPPGTYTISVRRLGYSRLIR